MISRLHNLEEIYFATDEVIHLAYDIKSSHIPLNNGQLKAIKLIHEHMANHIVGLQQKGASMEFICAWAKSVLSQVEKKMENNGVFVENIQFIFKEKTEIDKLSNYQNSYQPLVEKMHLEQDIAPQPTDSTHKAPVNKI